MSNETDQVVADYLKEIGIVYSVQFVANMDHDKEWQHDLWSCMFKNGKNVERFDYKTGIGHRKVKIRMPYYIKESKSQATIRQWTKENEKPVAPTAASVLYCLLLDADAKNYSFSDWCDCFGYSSDSISALHTYQACEKTADQLLKIFTRQQMAKLQELLQDY